MATTRLISRIPTPRMSTIRTIWSHPRRHFPEKYFTQFNEMFDQWKKHFDQFGTAPLATTVTSKDWIVTDSNGEKKFHLSFNVQDFKPEEIKIKTEKNLLTIAAKKENQIKNKYSLHEFLQTYTLPEEINLDEIKSTYTENGIISIEAPLKKPTRNRQIPIERVK